uniref:Uncharacterized protein n=1 Tax=Panagrolaimus sp. PS1159 TaxID=55785 RepID=A0AC35GC60_9BILA
MPRLLEYSATCVSDFTTAHLKKFAKFNNLEEFALWGMTETFDIEKGFEYLKVVDLSIELLNRNIEKFDLIDFCNS